MGTPFDSIPRKLAVPLVALTAVGWLLVVIGFGIATNENDPPDFPRTGPTTYPLWMVSICGPFIFIAAIAHAALWQPISSMVGAITSFLSVLFITALGMLAYSAGQSIRFLNDIVPDWLALIFAGAVIATLFWTLLIGLWLFYDTATSEDSVPFQGIARKITLPFIPLTGAAWLLVVIGFGIGSNEDDITINPAFLVLQIRNDPISYLYWAVCISGPFVLVAAAIHAALWKPISSIVGAVMVLLNGFFLTGLGMILFSNGQLIRMANDISVPVPAFFALEFSGALLATLFWTPVMMLWHFYDVDQKDYNVDQKK